ncbi:MAG: phosphoribosyltransferase [Candidatus Dactylopiibacterium carminicum]|uniref:Orotate phosphoribosyltransferase n=1 Tax=Candidatus Dactylopiibacterium carminicum TaxID=857335 RepID=A0A272EVR4_9RHOO|nr:phosphoribosyltransferase [Candidatus Dactylopiibacterium carminicum]KAF7599869.1 phosphoribosyltransferase [Candidatus Dactylopiibacterium carminicum]PAS94192.1 MAG: phosphoribosyltransferase [Candidatus Dactylopiibacterium carminicum]PAS96736.1 MAG: phosphoribosyltransferase [Candidatus Dactylopiibacterium carminicum]PAS99869.1 MAG: phosphoribosyltransferase [Candidatus Dactylopiibacterium carminicum]
MQASLLSPSRSARVAEVLVALGAVRITTAQPFIYTSGWASPVYVDTRLLMSDVALRREVMDIAAEGLIPLVARQGINAIVGAESSGIAVAAWLAERLALPLLYLRKRPMGWGNSARLEGRLPDQACLLHVDDVTTDGRSKVAAAQSLRGTGARTADSLVLVDYAIYPQSRELFAEHNLTLHALTSWAHLHAALLASGKLDAEEAGTLAAFSADPVQWSIEHGGVGA